MAISYKDFRKKYGDELWEKQREEAAKLKKQQEEKNKPMLLGEAKQNLNKSTNTLKKYVENNGITTDNNLYSAPNSFTIRNKQLKENTLLNNNAKTVSKLPKIEQQNVEKYQNAVNADKGQKLIKKVRENRNELSKAQSNFDINQAKERYNNASKLEKAGFIISSPVRSAASMIFRNDNRVQEGKKSYNLPNYSEAFNNEVSQNSGTVGKIANDIGWQVGKLAVSSALNGIVPGLGSAAYSADMFDNSYNSALREGYTQKQATTYATIGTVTEFATQKLLGAGVGRFKGNSPFEDFIGDKLKKIISSESINKVISSMTSEGIEEFTQEYIDQLNRNLTLGEDEKIFSKERTKQALYSALIGALSGGMTQGTGNLMRNSIDAQSSQIIYDIERVNNTNLSETNKSLIYNTVFEKYLDNSVVNPKEVMDNFLQEKQNKKESLRESAKNSGLDVNNEKTINLLNSLNKFIDDKHYDITFDSSIGNNINGVNINGDTIKINPKSNDAIEKIALHEVTHSISTKKMQELVLDYAKKKPEFEQALNNLKKTYNTNEINDEVLADISGELFGNQEFINSLSNEEPSIFKKLHDSIISIANSLTGNTKENLFTSKLKSQWEQAYRNVQNNDIQNTQYMMVGKKGVKNAIKNDAENQFLLDLYKNAHKMRKANIENEKIRQKTGWFQDKNKDWKFELSDEDAKIKISLNKNKIYKLNDILIHDDLYELYPKLRNVKIIFKDFDDKIKNNITHERRGEFNRLTKNISLNNKLIARGNDAVLDTLLHEVQHWVQSNERFEHGANPDLGQKKYNTSFGEQEARDTTSRRNMTYEERKINAPISSMITGKRTFVKNLKSWYNASEENQYAKDNQKDNNKNSEYNSLSRNLRSGNARGQELDYSSFSIGENFKQKQLDIILKNNPVEDDYHTWIRNVDDIKTFEETLQDSDWEGWEENGFDPDYTSDMVNHALETGKITVYSSYPIEEGIFVSPSKMEAESYSGNGKVYSKEVNLNDVAWIDPTQGQYAKVNDDKYYKYNKNWQDFVKDNFKSSGTKTYSKDIKLPYNQDVNVEEKNQKNNFTFITQEEREELQTLENIPFDMTEEEQSRYKYLQKKLQETEKLVKNTKSPLDNRSYEEVGNRKVNAYQYDHPEVKPYFQKMADKMLSDLSDSQKGERLLNTKVASDTNYSEGWIGMSRRTTDDIAELLDSKYNYTYNDIRDGLLAIIEDHGAENIAISKRIEFALDERLRKGFTDIDGYEWEPNEDYIKLLNELNDKPKLPKQSIDNNNQKINLPKNPTLESSYEMPEKKKTRKFVQEEMIKDMGITEKDLQIGKDIINLSYQRTDPIRVNEKVFGAKIGQKINDATVNKTKHNEAERIRFLNKERQEISDLNIKPRSKESAAVQKYGEKQYLNDKGEYIKYGDMDLIAEFPNIETQNKIKNAAKVLRQKYDNYIEQINSVITELGYNPIPKRKDYMRHFQELDDKLSRWGIPLNPSDMNSENLPTDINGITDQFKPGKNWFASAMQRKGLKTTYDAITGIDGYLEGASNLIYHTEDIQRYRALSKMIRETYGQTKGFDNISKLNEQDAQQRVEDIFNNKLSGYVAWLDEQANALAGKKGGIDRAAERLLGRRIYNILDTAKKQVGSNMTGFNVRSALTNFASAVQGASKTNKLAFVKGTLSTLQNYIHNDGMIDKSDFLTSRFGSDQLSKKIWQKASNAGQIFMSGSDYFTANQVWRSKYYENIQKGMKENDAIKNADDFSSRIMGDRSKGSTAELFNSKTLGLLTQFQLEVNNQWSSIVHDNKMDIERGNKSGATVVFQLGQLFAMSYFFNNFMKTLTGSDVMIDPIDMLKDLIGGEDDDEEKSIEERATSVLGKIVNNLPFASFLTGGRIPISEAFKGIGTGLKKAIGQTDNYGNKIEWKDVGKDTISSAFYWLLPSGYGQLKKTIKGISMYDKKLPIAGSYTESGNLRFAADTSTKGKVKSILFGQYSSEEAQKYMNDGFKAISKSRIQEIKNLDMNTSQYKKYREGLKTAGTTNKDKIEYIANLKNVSDKQKNIMAQNVLKNDSFDINEYKKYDSYDEYNYAIKNPGKHAVITQITSYDKYLNYKKELKEIRDNTTEDKNETLKYINDLNLSIPQKAIFIKQYYPSFNQYNQQIIEYINQQNMALEEKQTILENLKFTIRDGRVYW